jgi:intracellular sulfur oxidation DsrE/DsrF family protein
MFEASSNPTPRRGFLGRLAAVAAAAGVSSVPQSLRADNTSSAPEEDEWLKKLNAKNRQLFDAPGHGDGLPLVHVLNYLNALNTPYGVKDSDINTVFTLYGALNSTMLFAFNDNMWTKYNMGAALKFNDHKTGQPATRNVWRADPQVLGMMLAPPASIESLQKRGTLFLACNNALNLWAGLLAQANKLETPAVVADLKANMLPGVVLVPAMVVAIQRIQDKGIAYNRQ